MIKLLLRLFGYKVTIAKEEYPVLEEGKLYWAIIGPGREPEPVRCVSIEAQTFLVMGGEEEYSVEEVLAECKY